MMKTLYKRRIRRILSPNPVFSLKCICALLLASTMFFLGCSRYRPSLMMGFTKKGGEITIKKVAKGQHPSWSPDGKSFVFDHHGIQIIHLETKKRQKITDEGEKPCWSPDGKKIVYCHNGVWIWDIHSESHRQLTSYGDNPCWFPDSKTLAIVQDGIWEIDIDKGTKKKIADEGIPLALSPDGRFLLVELWHPDTLLFTISSLSLDTGEQRRLVDGTKASFAPNGEYIVYSKEGIWIYSQAEKDSKLMVLDGYAPQWSPQGDKIAFYSKGYIWTIDSPYRLDTLKDKEVKE